MENADQWIAAFEASSAIVAALSPVGSTSPSSMVVLRAEVRPGRTPLWLVHPLSGSVQPYEALAQHAVERPVYVVFVCVEYFRMSLDLSLC